MPFDHGLSVTIGAVLGGIATKILTQRLRREEMTHAEADAIRKELREDVIQLQTKIERLGSDLDQWKDRYYKLADENINLRSRCRTLELEVVELRKMSASQNALGSSPPQSDSIPPPQ